MVNRNKEELISLVTDSLLQASSMCVYTHTHTHASNSSAGGFLTKAETRLIISKWFCKLKGQYNAAANPHAAISENSQPIN